MKQDTPKQGPEQEVSWASPPLPTLVTFYSVFHLRFLFSIGSQNSGPFPPLPTDLVFPAFIQRVLTEQGLLACLSSYRRPSLVLTPVSRQCLVDPSTSTYWARTPGLSVQLQASQPRAHTRLPAVPRGPRSFQHGCSRLLSVTRSLSSKT